ncbi:hypothetical protein ACHAWU_005429 [Discostella pseudostelligera]|uniref:J domain-containing protein n=1 Tax=Discostella pseudostelligera TaxID=259834 RepID=A0ABD3MVL9_9STRA
MKAYQIKFLAWTFSAFLPPDDPSTASNAEVVDCYALLDVPKNANADDLKKAYRKRSLLLHPDKLRQRGMRYEGKVITEEEARLQFQRMKAAYDILSDPKKRQIYDCMGHRGMDYVLNPSHAFDPQVLLGNLAKSSVFDRAKLMALIILFFGLVLLQPILLCAKVDQMLEKNGGALEDATWVALLIPFWLFAACFAVLLIIGRAVLPLLQFVSFVVAILFLALKFDNVVSWSYAALFIPFYLWMLLRVIEAFSDMRAVESDMMKMVTIEYVEKFIINEKKQDEDGNDIEGQLHRTYNDLNEEERDAINKDYIIVHVPPKAQAPAENEHEEEENEFERIERSPEYHEARARFDHARKSIHRIILPEIPLIILVIVQLDHNKSWNWGLTFLPLWISMFLECTGGCVGFCCTSALARMEVQDAMANHFAKEQEAKTSCEPKDNAEVKKANIGEPKGNGEIVNNSNSTEKVGEEVEPKTDLTNDDTISDTARPSALEQPVKSNPVNEAGIDTAVIFEPATKIEPTISATKDDKTNGEAKKNEEENEDDEFVFEMDEDTFRFFQQAEMEAENKATEAQSKAIGSFCNIIFQTIIASLFVAKLNQVYGERDEDQMEDGTTSFSTFWILFPFFVISGCIVSCFACAIFGARNFEAAMSSEDAGVNEESGGNDEETRTTEASPVVVPTQPPSQGIEVPKQNDDVGGQSNAPLAAESLLSITTEVNRTAPAELVVTDDPKSAMDDLD